MYHGRSSYEKRRLTGRRFTQFPLLLLALLVGDAAAGFAGGLAGGLALAAAALFGALAEAAGLQGLDSLHMIFSHLIEF
jgi:hypothetical protein